MFEILGSPSGQAPFRERATSLGRSCCLSNTPSLSFVSLQELIDVDSEVVFELASYILQVGSPPCLTTPRRGLRLSAQSAAIPQLGASSSLATEEKELLGTLIIK